LTAGTVAVIEFAVLAVTTAWIAPNLTTFFAGVVLKFDPVMVTVDPALPLDGDTAVTMGLNFPVTGMF